MRIAELVLAYVRVLVWPATVVILMVLFRSRVHHLFDRMNKVDAFGASIEFVQSVGAAREALSAAQDPAREVPASSGPGDSHDEDAGHTRVADAAQHALDGIPAWRWPAGNLADARAAIDIGVLRQARQSLAAALDRLEQAFGPLTRASASQMSERMQMAQWGALMRALDGADRANSLASYLITTAGSDGLSPYHRELAADYLTVISGALDLLADTLAATIKQHRAV
ncbi:hypothetical protein ACGFNF_24440 [Micromonospora sp. NPDC048868]|uniref:hypothetical protein n=1 Tax=Micromonospora sp. NPDC048868 TaxID=3364258 RepID=UPI0037144054